MIATNRGIYTPLCGLCKFWVTSYIFHKTIFYEEVKGKINKIERKGWMA